MPSVTGKIEFLVDSPLYQTEKPYLYLPSKEENLDPDRMRLDNLEFESYGNILIKDMREYPQLKLEECGFESYRHTSRFSGFNSPTDIDGYRSETEHLLQKRFSATKVVTYEVRLRKNQNFTRKEFDVYDKMLVEGPAKGAHNDVTFTSGPNIIQRYLSPQDQSTYLRPGYRFQIFNTWRPLNSVLEDRPLALCDSRTVVPADLIAADRILPDRVGEVYYLRHNSGQQWYWLEKQTSSEPLIFLMYDTQGVEGAAHFCPHVSFDNPRKSVNAEPRSSVETRSIVITKDE